MNPDIPRDLADLGDVDGEQPDLATVKITGSGVVDRALLRGERVALTVVGEVSGIAFKTQNGALVRSHTIKAETIAEATGQLATDVTDFLREVDDQREGRKQLPLDEEDTE
jgi:hypothetical protein